MSSTVERNALIAVQIGKVRPGDVVSMCDGFEPDVEIASIEYIGYRTGLAEHVRVTFEGEDGPYLIPRSPHDKPGCFDGYDRRVYVPPEVADGIKARPGAMAEFYEQDGEHS